MVKLTEANIDAEIDRLAEQYKEILSKDPHSMAERFAQVMMFKEPDRMPVFMQIHDHAAKIAGIKLKGMCTDPKMALYAALYAGVKYELDAIFNAADAYNFEAEALGAKMLYPEDSFPVILEPLIKEPRDLEKVKIPDLSEAGRVPYLIEGNKLKLEKLGEVGGLPFAVGCAPWSLAVQLRGFNNLIKDVRKNPQFAHKLLDFCNDIIEDFIKTQKKEMGSESLFPVLADAFSCIPPTSPQLVYDYVIPHTADLIKKLGMAWWAGGYPIVEIPRWEQIVEDSVTKSGTFVGTIGMLESDWMPPEKIKQISNKLHKPWLFGTRAGLISGSTPSQIDNYVKKTIKILGPGGGCMVFGDQVPRDTPPENLQTFVNSIKKYGKYPISIK
jgi:uroporphyrinogen decarboxylase